MAEGKKQHYVPKFYLRYFLFDKNRFYLYNIEDDDDIGLVPYKEQCYEKYFYGDDLVWEKALSKQESEWNASILKTLDNDFSELNLIREFVLFQLARTKAFNDRLEKTTSRQIEEMLTAQFGDDIDATKTKAIKAAADKKAEELTKPSMSLNMINGLLDTISDLAFVRIHYKTKQKIISSDNPVLVINPYLPPHVGLGSIGLIIIFPISPENLGVFYDSKIYDRFRNKQFVEIKNEAEVKRINALMYANASELIYSNKPFENNIFCFKNRQLRKDNKEHDNVGFFGTPTDKIVVTQNPTIYHDMTFSFTRMDPVFARIDGDCRDNVQRKYDVKWKRKLFDRSQDWFVEMAWKYIEDIDIQHYKDGYKEFYKAMLKYWDVDE